jgi:hypothetical protein
MDAMDALDESDDGLIAGWTLHFAGVMTKRLREIVRLPGQSAKGLDGHLQSDSRSLPVPELLRRGEHTEVASLPQA